MRGLCALIGCLAILMSGVENSSVHDGQYRDTGIVYPGDRSSATGKIHILLVMQTTDPEIGRSVATDLNNLKQLFTLGLPEHQRRMTILSGTDVTPANVLNHYDRLDSAPEDTVLCYYSGHGKVDQQFQKQYFPIGSGSDRLYRSELLEAMKRKRARLTVLLADACSLTIVTSPVPELAAVVVINAELLRSLLFRHAGVVDINACKMGESAESDTMLGGYYTHSFVKVCQGSNLLESWPEFHAEVARGTTALHHPQHPTPFTPLTAVHYLGSAPSGSRLGQRTHEPVHSTIKQTE
jgi:hypothetical protein